MLIWEVLKALWILLSGAIALFSEGRSPIIILHQRKIQKARHHYCIIYFGERGLISIISGLVSLGFASAKI
jgi:hypothetical protein